MNFIQPRFSSATTVQCEVYRQLSNLGIEAEAEYKVNGSRFDLVVIKNGRIIAIIETKKHTQGQDLQEKVNNLRNILPLEYLYFTQSD